MNYFFYNTDAKSLVGPPRFNKLIDQDLGATSGPRRFGEQLSQLAHRDILLMYEDGKGVVAVGSVLKPWDGKSHKIPLYYKAGDEWGEAEYRIEVDWFRDLSKKPIGVAEIKKRLGYTPRGAVTIIRKHRIEVEKMLDECVSLPPPSSEATDLAAPKPERVAVTAYRILRDTEKARRVKLRHNYQCQICGHTIELPNGARYAEAHHIRPLGSPHNGPDVIGNIVCVCPNHHAQLDYGAIQLTLTELHDCEGHSIDPKYVKYHNCKILGNSSVKSDE